MEGLYQIGIIWSKPGNENFVRVFNDLFFTTFYWGRCWSILFIEKNELRTINNNQSIFDLLFSV
ncbi:hypothetical protein D3C86_484330 [compost metagenome]